MKRLLPLLLLTFSTLWGAKQIIILENSQGPGGDQNVRYIAWYPVVAGREVPIPGFISLYRACTAAELADLQSGKVLEEANSTQYPATHTLAQIQSDLQTRWTSRNSELALLPNPNLYYGSNWDGLTWSVAAVAPGQLARLSYASARGSGSGTVTVVAATSGQTIQVFQLMITASTAGTLQLKTGAGNLGPLIDLAVGVPIILAERATREPWFALPAGNALGFTTSAGSVNASVQVWYQKF